MSVDMSLFRTDGACGAVRARVLAETLPYLRAYHGEVFVIDYAARSRGSVAAWKQFGRDLALLGLVGLRLVVVHRGGALNTELISLINGQGGQAIGVSGLDSACVKAWPDPRVGEPAASLQVDPSLLRQHLSQGLVPVVRPLATGPDGHACPVDGAALAAAIAMSLAAAKLIVMGDAPGVLDQAGRIRHRLSASELELLEPGDESRLWAAALRGGVGTVHRVDARRPDVLLLEVLTRDSQGSLVLPDDATDVLAHSARYFQFHSPRS